MSCAVPRGFLNKLFPTRKKNESLTQMNILVTSPSPQVCARNLDNWTLESQIVTVAILLSRYAMDCLNPINDLHRFVKKNHPFMRWMQNDAKNADWMLDYGIMLLIEYGIRTKERHYGSQCIYDYADDYGAPIGLEPIAFLNRSWDDTFDFRHEKDTFNAYRWYLNAMWTVSRKPISWGSRMPPAWYIEEQLKREGIPPESLLIDAARRQ